MNRIEALEAVGTATSVGSFVMARQIDMGEFAYLANNYNTFMLVAALGGSVALLTEAIKRIESKQHKK